jgi:hypothetical protein
LFTANTVVQQFLPMLAFERNEKKGIMLIHWSHLTKVLAVLVNPMVTEINCASFQTTVGVLTYNDFLVEHALKNCPKISKIKFLSRPSRFACKNPLIVLPAERLKKSWSNLTSINASGYFCDENTLKLMLDNFPSIESVYYIPNNIRNDFKIVAKFICLQGVERGEY